APHGAAPASPPHPHRTAKSESPPPPSDEESEPPDMTGVSLAKGPGGGFWTEGPAPCESKSLSGPKPPLGRGIESSHMVGCPTKSPGAILSRRPPRGPFASDAPTRNHET